MSFQPPPFLPGRDETRAPQLAGSTLTVTILALVIVLVRLYTRLKVSRSVGWDDYTILAAMVVLLLSMILIMVQIQYGVGRHIFTLSIENLVRSGRYYHIIEILYIPGTALIKISACLFLLRIMTRGTSQALRWAMYLLMAVILVLSLATGFTIIFRCLPVAGGWDPRIHARCFSYAQILGIGYAQGAWSIITDFACAGFPIIILRKLQINPRVKFALWGIMGLGILSSICCVVKIVYLGDLAKGDFTYNGVDVIIWGTLEQNIGVIACSVPALQPLFKRWFDSRSSKGEDTPGARNNPVLVSWDDSTDLTYLSRSQSSQSTTLSGAPRGEDVIHPLEARSAKGTRSKSDRGYAGPECGDSWDREATRVKKVHLV